MMSRLATPCPGDSFLPRISCSVLSEAFTIVLSLSSQSFSQLYFYCHAVCLISVFLHHSGNNLCAHINFKFQWGIIYIQQNSPVYIQTLMNFCKYRQLHDYNPNPDTEQSHHPKKFSWEPYNSIYIVSQLIILHGT